METQDKIIYNKIQIQTCVVKMQSAFRIFQDHDMMIHTQLEDCQEPVGQFSHMVNNSNPVVNFCLKYELIT